MDIIQSIEAQSHQLETNNVTPIAILVGWRARTILNKAIVNVMSPEEITTLKGNKIVGYETSNKRKLDIIEVSTYGAGAVKVVGQYLD